MKKLLLAAGMSTLCGCAGFFAAPPESPMQRLQPSAGAESDWLASRTAHYEQAGLPSSRAREQAERDLRSPAGTNSSPVPAATK